MAKLRRIGFRITNKAPRMTLNIDTLHSGPAFHDTILLHACFQVLVNFVDEVGGVAALKLSDNPARDAIRKLHTYWTEVRPRMIHKEQEAREYSDRGDLAAREATRKQSDDECLAYLIELRPFLTTDDSWKILSLKK